MTTAHSSYARQAVKLMGQLIRMKRLEHKLTAEELATRAGISRSLLQRIEKGELGTAIGSVFEVAAILGLALFDMDKAALNAALAQTQDRLTLLPKSARMPTGTVKDDF